MCFIKNQMAFEKYLEFLVGRVQAESVVVSTAVQEFYKVPLPPTLLAPSPRSFSLTVPCLSPPAREHPPACTGPQALA